MGKGGEEGFPDENFFLDDTLFAADSVQIENLITNSKNRRTVKKTFYNTEFGLSDRFTFFINIPFFSSLREETNWEGISSSDTIAAVIDTLLEFYHPDRSTSGLGDIRWGFNFLLFGSPAWEGESILSVYGSIGMKLPTARVIPQFNGAKLDSTGRPKQFNRFPLGDGITQWSFSLFGEFYREIFKRLIRINWQIQYWMNVEGKLWTRITPRGIFTVDHDIILQKIGKVYRLKQGDVFSSEIEGFLELFPDRLSINMGQSWIFKGRDRYHSGDEEWNEWMAGGTDLHRNYDTRSIQVIQFISFLFHNIHPLKKIGPLPFEVETRMDIPFLTRHSWRRVSLSVSLSIYSQFW